MSQALLGMMMLAFLGALCICGVTDLFLEKDSKKARKIGFSLALVWLLFWGVPPLARLWVLGVMG